MIPVFTADFCHPIKVNSETTDAEWGPCLGMDATTCPTGTCAFNNGFDLIPKNISVLLPPLISNSSWDALKLTKLPVFMDANGEFDFKLPPTKSCWWHANQLLIDGTSLLQTVSVTLILLSKGRMRLIYWYHQQSISAQSQLFPKMLISSCWKFNTTAECAAPCRWNKAGAFDPPPTVPYQCVSRSFNNCNWCQSMFCMIHFLQKFRWLWMVSWYPNLHRNE